MPGEGALVGQYAQLLSPQPGHHQILMITNWKMYQSINTPTNPYHRARTQMVGDKLLRIPDFCCLRGHEQAFLAARQGEQSVTIGAR